MIYKLAYNTRLFIRNEKLINFDFIMEKQQSRLASDLYNKDYKGTLLPNKEISKRKGRPTKLFKFLEDDETELVPKQLMN